MFPRGFFATLVVSLGMAAPSLAAPVTLDFDSGANLASYAPEVTFSANIGLWSGGSSVLPPPHYGGPVSEPYGICVGPCGSLEGFIYFATAQTALSIYALSGPGPDPLSAGTLIEAYDAGDQLIDWASVDADLQADPTLQFKLLSVAGAGIVKLRLYSPVANTEAWDNLTYNSEALVIPAPAPLLLLLSGLVGLAWHRRRLRV
ncbi:MAG: hypothetical protein QF491_09590 [Alphaproteobacteria bacterium]|jgi:hypothetical protein|nr:hypothetical protein [Alphaproteobacteria bacterium]